MKRIVSVIAMFTLICISTPLWASGDKNAISKNVDAIVSMIDGGIDATQIRSHDFTPYAFIMEESGTMLVHPSLAGINFKEKKELAPIYQALSQANTNGIWVEYQWKGDMKNTYTRRTKSNLIIGSGY